MTLTLTYESAKLVLKIKPNVCKTYNESDHPLRSLSLGPWSSLLPPHAQRNIAKLILMRVTLSVK